MALFWIIQNIDCMCFLNFRTSKIPTFCQLLFFFCNYWHNVNKQHLKSRETYFSQAKLRHANWRIFPQKKQPLFGWNIWPRIFNRFFLILIFSAPPPVVDALKFLKKPLVFFNPKKQKISISSEICFKSGSVDHKMISTLLLSYWTKVHLSNLTAL